MTLSYNVTGSERKRLVGTISQELNAPAKYLGAPTFSYEVGGYRISQDGAVTGKDNLDLEDALHQKGFDAQKSKYDEPDTYESGLGGMGAVPSIEEISDEAVLLAERETRRFDVVRNVEITPAKLVIEIPAMGFTPDKLDNLCKLVAAKSMLIKAAIGADDLPIEQSEDTLAFPWFRFTDDGDSVQAYSTLISLLCKTAIEKKRVTAKESSVDGSPKYAMRCFLLSLGFVGTEYKTERKILLSKLSGSSSFKTPKREAVDNA